MSSRQAEKVRARQARIEAQARVEAAATRRLRKRVLAGAVAVALAAAVAAVAVSSQGSVATGAAGGGRVVGTDFSRRLLAGIPQHGVALGRPDAPVLLVEFADLQCPYCDEYARQALPTLVNDYVRTGRVRMEFENLSFIGPDSVSAGRVAAAAAQQDKLWNFVDLLYLNHGEENSGYVTPPYLHGLLAAVPGLNVRRALDSSREPSADAALAQANQLAQADGVSATPSFLIGPAAGPLHPFTPSALDAGGFVAPVEQALRDAR